MGGDLHAAVYDYANDQMVISVTPLWTGAGALRTRRRGSRWTPSGCGTRPTQAAPSESRSDKHFGPAAGTTGSRAPTRHSAPFTGLACSALVVESSACLASRLRLSVA